MIVVMLACLLIILSTLDRIYQFLVITATKRRHLYNAMCNCSFVGNKMTDNVDRFSHLGHIITSSLLDGDDIVQRRNTFLSKPTKFYAF